MQWQRDPRDVENFMWDLKAYFDATKISSEEQAYTNAVFLSGEAKLWWWTQVATSVEAGAVRNLPLVALKDRICCHFILGNANWLARDALQKLKHIESARTIRGGVLLLNTQSDGDV